MSLSQESIWYHPMDLAGESTKLAGDWVIAGHTKESRSFVSYEGKQVLDLASFDGYWAFEAERLGASRVIATDAIDLSDQMNFVRRAYEKFLYAKEKLKSGVIPYYNVSVHTLSHTLIPFTGKFDIIQHLGLLYHLENPWQSLKECRKSIKDGGNLLVETAYSTRSGALLIMNRGSSAFCAVDVRTYWTPTEECLRLMLAGSGFDVVENAVRKVGSGDNGRISLVAAAKPLPEEFNNQYRSL